VSGMSITESHHTDENGAAAEQRIAVLEATLREVDARLALMIERARAAHEQPTIVVVPRRRWGVRQFHFGRDRTEAR
jgi:hypothetical protein